MNHLVSRLFMKRMCIGYLHHRYINTIGEVNSELPAGVDDSHKHTSTSIGVIGVPFSKGSKNSKASGVEDAPYMLREFGLVKEMQKLGHDVKDYGDILCSTNHLSKRTPDGSLPQLPCLNDLSQASENLSKVVQTAIKDERKVLIVGGDHSIALGSVDGHMKAKNGKACLLWVDAHADLNTADTSDTGNMHGMPVSLLVKELLYYWPYLPGFEWQKPELSIQNIAYIGLRSVDKYERFIIEKYGVSAYGMEDIEKYGIHAVTRLALEKINPDHSRSLHVSFDIDALDALEAPCTGTPVRGGLTLREAVHIMEVAHRTGWLQVVDMVEINPSIGNPQQLKVTLEAAMALIKAAFGFSRSGYVPKHISKLPGFYAPIKGENEDKNNSPPQDKK